jgi:hypothetical protein
MKECFGERWEFQSRGLDTLALEFTNPRLRQELCLS